MLHQAPVWLHALSQISAGLPCQDRLGENREKGPSCGRVPGLPSCRGHRAAYGALLGCSSKPFASPASPWHPPLPPAITSSSLPSPPLPAIPISSLTAVEDLGTSTCCVVSSIDSYPESEGIQDKLLRGWS